MDLKRLTPLYLGAAIGPMGGVGIVTLIPVLAKEWDVSFPTASLTITFYMTPFVVMQLFSGSIAQVFDARKTLLFGFLVYALGGVLCGLSPHLGPLLGSRIIQGIGAAFLTPIIMALIGELVPQEHTGKAIGLLGMAYTVGVTLGPLISGIIDVRYGWPWFFHFLAAVAFVSGIFYGFSDKSPRRQKSSPVSISAVLSVFREALLKPRVMPLSFSAFAFFIAYIGIMTFTADHLKRVLGLPSDRIGLLISSAGFSGIVASPVAGYLGDRLGRTRVFLGGAGLSLVCIALMAVTAFSYRSSLLLFLLFGTGAATAWTSLNTLAVEIVPTFRKPVTSVYNAIKFSGYALSPVLLSLVYGPFDLAAVQWSCIGAIAISALLALRAARGAGGTACTG